MIDCAFCEEFAQQTDETWIVARTADRVVLPTIGCLTEGYLLYMPHEHTLAFADMTESSLVECERDLTRICLALNEKYGATIVAEHGPRQCDIGAGCCDHAHMHLIPVPDPDLILKSYVQVGGETRRHASLAECMRSVETAYVYLSPTPGQHYIWPATGFPRQWVRRVCAEVHGKPDMWDWRDHYFELERRRTYDALVGTPLLAPDRSS